jgi:hypothetical protein
MYLFFDEIQEVEDWEQFIRRITQRKDVRIFLTGSSSKLLSREIATSLRGRTLSYNLFPLSLREFLIAEGFKPYFPLIEPERGRLQRHLDQYLTYGGFPELIHQERIIILRILKEYLDLIIYRDLIDRYGIAKISAMKFLIRSLAKNFAREMSVRKLHNFFLSTNASLSKNKVYDRLSQKSKKRKFLTLVLDLKA